MSRELLLAPEPTVQPDNLSPYQRQLARYVRDWLKWARENAEKPMFLGLLDQFQTAHELSHGVITIPLPGDVEFDELAADVRELLLHWQHFLSAKDDELVRALMGA